jgi:uncharacterized membrane protein YciS (DUF1049 family)
VRFFSLLILVVIIGAVAVFAAQNYNEMVTVNYLDRSLTLSFPVLAGAVFVLGMFTGWSIVGLLKRSWHRVIEEPRR